MNEIELVRAIKSLKPNSQFVFNDNKYDSINWIHLEGNAPTLSEIESELERLKQQDIIESNTREAARQALLDRLGITEEEARLLLG